MSRRLNPVNDVKLSRPFAIFVDPASDCYSDGKELWLVSIVGYGLDNMTQGVDAVDAVEMAADLLNLVSGRCSLSPDHRHEMSIEGKSFKEYSGTIDGKTFRDSFIDVPAYGCRYCDFLAAPDQCIEEVDLPGVPPLV